MARQHLLQNHKSIVAAALVGLGLFILFRHAADLANLARSLRIVGYEADSLGILTASIMAIRRTLQAYLFNHTEFLQSVYRVLISFSALLLIVTGMLFLQPSSRWEGKDLRKKKAACRFNCLSFDA